MNYWRVFKWLAIGLVLLLIAIQFLPVGGEQTNPPVIQEPAWDEDITRELAVRACFDCHSNETIWPWYGKIAPLSWMVTKDVLNGREALNFSEWTPEEQAETDVEVAVDMIARDIMPLPYYEILHPEARLSTVEEGQLINGLIETLSPPQGEGLSPEALDDGESD